MILLGQTLTVRVCGHETVDVGELCRNAVNALGLGDRDWRIKQFVETEVCRGGIPLYALEVEIDAGKYCVLPGAIGCSIEFIAALRAVIGTAKFLRGTSMESATG